MMLRTLTLALSAAVAFSANAAPADSGAQRVVFSWEVNGKPIAAASRPVADGQVYSLMLVSDQPRDETCKMLTLYSSFYRGKGYVAVRADGRATKGTETSVCAQLPVARVQYPLDAKSGEVKVGDKEGSVLVWKLVPDQR
jgi:hypothetical protein